jgi:cell division septal protein FtsQ
MRRKNPTNTRTRPVRRPDRTHRNRPRPNWRLLLTVFSVSAVAALGASYVATTPNLRVDKVVVTGVAWADRAHIADSGRYALGRNVLFFSKRPIVEAILQTPEVESVRVDRVLPRTVKLRIEEHKPCAVAADGKKLYLIDEEGLAFHRVSKPVPGAPTIVLKDTKVSGLAVGKASVEVCLALDALGYAAEERLQVSKISVDPDGDMCLNMIGGLEIRLGQAQALPDKMSLVRRALDGKPELLRDALYIDVSCPKYPAWMPKSASATASL